MAELGLVVVVEDDDSLREMICEMLGLAGFRTTACRDGLEALKTIKEVLPAVVTLDLHMPGMDGIEVLDHLGRDERTRSIPVVVVSAYVSDRRLRPGGQVKFVIQKPFDLDELWQKVKKASMPPDRCLQTHLPGSMLRSPAV